MQWRWYQNGYDHEPTDAEATPPIENYVSHHNGAQYFGYIANNPAEQTNLRGEGDFFSDMAKNVLPRSGGVFYIRGGYYNLKYPKQSAVIQNPNYPDKNGLTPTELAAIRIAKSGDDDHPSYSDSQLTEAMAARVINAIAANKDIWEHSAIVITYDESDGLYDHVPPRILSYGPDGLPLARGIRIPLLLISPYARVHAVSHAEGDHNAVIETINALFGLPALSSLPDEKEALRPAICPSSTPSGLPASSRSISGRVTRKRRRPQASCPASTRRGSPARCRRCPAPMRRSLTPTSIRFRITAARAARRSGSRRRTCGRTSRT